MILSDALQKRLDNVKEMGINQLEDFKAEVINSLFDNQTKFYCYDIIDTRAKNLSRCIANSDEDLMVEL